MIEVFALFLVAVIAAAGLAFAINYFMDFGPWRALGIALFAVAIFLLFAATGLWDDANKYDWGKLTPVFAAMLVGGFLCLKFGKRLWIWWLKKQGSHIKK